MNEGWNRRKFKGRKKAQIKKKQLINEGCYRRKLLKGENKRGWNKTEENLTQEKENWQEKNDRKNIYKGREKKERKRKGTRKWMKNVIEKNYKRGK